MKYENKLELLNPAVLNHPGDELRLLRSFVISTLLIALVLLAVAGFLSIDRGNTLLLWYFLAFIIPFEFFLLAIYFYLNTRISSQWAQHCIQDLADFFRATVTTMAMAIDAKEQTEYGNILKVQGVALILARNHPDFWKLDTDAMAISALVHDIGKLAVPEGILNKPGGLTENELTRMQSHAEIGAEILETVPFPESIASYVRHHHERWDGSGYPDRIAGEAIPLGARILAIADTYVSLRSPRPFRRAWDVSHAEKIILEGSGKAYDPTVVKVFESRFQEIEEIVSRPTGSDKFTLPKEMKSEYPSGSNSRIPDPTTIFNSISFPHKEMQAEFEITRNMGKSLSLEETFSILATWIERFVPYTTCIVFRYDRENHHIRSYHSAGKYHTLLQNLYLSEGEGISGRVALDLEPRFGVSPETDFPSGRGIKGLKDCLVVPLVFSDELSEPKSPMNRALIGVLALYSDKEKFYTREHLKLMLTIAKHAAQAVNNSIVHNETREDAFTDSLTGLPNIRYFNASIENEIHRAQRLNYPINFLMMDLDDFKIVNDVYGHKEGDRILIKISDLLKEQFRKSDICIRYGGDEFLAILPGIGSDATAHTMERISGTFSDTVFKASNGDPLNLGISIGAASYPKDGDSPEVLLVTADRNMYKNKKWKKERKKPQENGERPS